MPEFQRCNARNVVKVLRNIIHQCEDPDLSLQDREFNLIGYADALNEMLDALLAEDFFGTEGQTDPRGDHR